MRVMLVDDEKSTLDTICYLLKDYEDFEVELASTDPAKALEALQQTPADVLFLDIEMPAMSGMSFCERAKEIDSNIIVVFLTAYENYAVKAFEMGALDYLLKPVTRTTLDRTISRIRERFSQQNRSSPGKMEPQLGMDADVVLGVMGSKHYIIDLSEALYVEVVQRSAFVVTPKGRFRLRNNITYWENYLLRRGWFKSHRVFLINLKKIESFTKLSNSVYTVHMTGCPDEIPVSRSYLAEFKQLLGI